jgi:hypothetical protein
MLHAQSGQLMPLKKGQDFPKVTNRLTPTLLNNFFLSWCVVHQHEHIFFFLVREK